MFAELRKLIKIIRLSHKTRSRVIALSQGTYFGLLAWFFISLAPAPQLYLFAAVTALCLGAAACNCLKTSWRRLPGIAALTSISCGGSLLLARRIYHIALTKGPPLGDSFFFGMLCEQLIFTLPALALLSLPGAESDHRPRRKDMRRYRRLKHHLLEQDELPSSPVSPELPSAAEFTPEPGWWQDTPVNL